ncbi:MAG: hypothetical protein V4819_21325 [Verrucomicrobiota bacterium]
MSSFFHFVIGAALVTRVIAGPFPADAIAAGDPRFVIWATGATVTRGPVEITFPEGAVTTFGTDANATGPANATADSPFPVVSLGDGGGADLTFAIPFGDVPGPDFAVFENGFSPGFLELAHVEVSSDGIHFYRFPSTSLTPVSLNPEEGSSVDPTEVRNLAGKYMAGSGTPFDLAELRSLYPELDTQRITGVRVIDAIGTNDPSLGSFDAAGHLIADPYPTPFPTGGFDLDAVGAFKATTTTYPAWIASQGFANPAPSADPDHNGVQNLIEYLTGNGLVEITGTTLHFSRLSYRAGGNLQLEASTDFSNWAVLAVSGNGNPMRSTGAATVAESGEFRKDVTIELLSNSPYRYFRLSAELAP